MDPQNMKRNVKIKPIIYNKNLVKNEYKYICTQHQDKNIKYTQKDQKKTDKNTKIRDFHSKSKQLKQNYNIIQQFYFSAHIKKFITKISKRYFHAYMC